MSGPLITLLAILVGIAVVGVAIWAFVRMLGRSKEMTCPTCGESLGAKYWTKADPICPNCGARLEPPPAS
jgi:predicted amidophosphoribosyltransferase